MRFLGLPFSSWLVLLIVPMGLVAYQYYLCWQIRTGRRQ